MAHPDRVPEGRIRLTYEDYVGLPNDGKRYEILDGDLAVTPAPAPKHQIVSANLELILQLHVRAGGLGTVLHAPIDVILASTTIVQPDILFLRAGRESLITERAIEGPPDLMVEILSPGSIRQDRVTKAALYARYEVPHYWLVDPVERTLELYELEEQSYRLATAESGEAKVCPSLFPGLGIELRDVWA